MGRGRGAGGRPAGVPELESLVPVKAETGEAGESLTPSEPVDVNGLAANGAEVWIADVAGGTLVRVR